MKMPSHVTLATLMIVLAANSVTFSLQAQVLDSDLSDECTLTPNSATTCRSPIRAFKATVVKLYLCTSMPRYSDFANCADTGLLNQAIEISPESGTTFESDRIPPDTYTHFGIVYDNRYEYSMVTHTNLPVTPDAGITSDPEQGEYCWTVAGARPDGYPRPQFQCGDSLPATIERGISEQTIFREGIFPKACFWTMGPPNSPQYENLVDQCMGGNPAFKTYELCTRYLKENYASPGLLACAETVLGEDLLTQSEVNAIFAAPDTGYSNRTYIDVLLDGTLSDSGALSLNLTDQQSDVKYKFVGRELASPVTVTSSSKGIDFQIAMTGGAFLTIRCGDEVCTGVNTELLSLNISPVPL